MQAHFLRQSGLTFKLLKDGLYLEEAWRHRIGNGGPPLLRLNRFYPRADYFEKIFLSGKSGMDRGAGGQVKLHFKDLVTVWQLDNVHNFKHNQTIQDRIRLFSNIKCYDFLPGQSRWAPATRSTSLASSAWRARRPSGTWRTRSNFENKSS